MNKMYRFWYLALFVFFVGCASGGSGSSYNSDSGSGSTVVKGSGSGVTITKPGTTDNVRNPVEVCMSTSGYTVEPAKNGVNAGKGHHHLIIDVDLPPAGSPIPKDENHVHMGDGSTCKKLTLSKGMHRIQALFAQGNHVPYDPPVTDSIVVFVK